MGILNWVPFTRAKTPQASVEFNSPEFYEYVRGQGSISITDALKNSTVFRCVDLISGSMAMLPLYIKERDTSGKMVEAVDNPLYRLLMYKPNEWQTAFEFKQIMQAWALVHGNAYARIVRTGPRVSALMPIPPDRVIVEQLNDYSLKYTVTGVKGGVFDVPPRDMLHIRGLTMDGVLGLSRVKQAADVISTAVQAQRAADRLFKNGIIGGTAFEHPTKLSSEAHARLKASLDGYSGSENAGRSMILEEGMKRQFPQANAQTSQLSETRAAQVEEIGRVFGVPRPLLGVDDTSWGSGIEQLAILFVRFGLSPWMKAWEEAVNRSMIPQADWGRVIADYDERELLRGTLKDQAEYFKAALGSGGHRPWMEANEVRDLSGLGAHAQGTGLVAAGEKANEPS